jgi:NADPH:quinone reductase-like Zn-dependent oxidoreductase
MKAIRIHEYGDANQLKLEVAPHLTIEDEQILVKVRDAGVNPVDWKIREGYLQPVMPASFPLTMGQDFSGEVVERGMRAQQFSIGQRVFGFAQGTYAEYVAAPAFTVAAMPDSVSFEIAAALPTAGSTALQIVRDVIRAHSGMNILIHGAAGGVGSFATQMAKHSGARVIATATGREDMDYLTSLRVDQLIDFRQEPFEEKVRGVDAVVDLVGGDTLARSYGVLRDGGVLATTVQPVAEQTARGTGVRAVHVVMKRNATDLTELAKLVYEGALKPRLSATMSLDEAKRAQELSQSGRSSGKLILRVA